MCIDIAHIIWTDAGIFQNVAHTTDRAARFRVAIGKAYPSKEEPYPITSHRSLLPAFGLLQLLQDQIPAPSPSTSRRAYDRKDGRLCRIAW